MSAFPPSLPPSHHAGLVAGVASFALTPAEKAFSLTPAVTVFHGQLELEAALADSLDTLVVGECMATSAAPAFWTAAMQALHPGGRLVAKLPAGMADEKRAREALLLGGFVDSSVDGLVVTALRPTWKHAAALPFAKKTKAANAAWQVVAADASLIDEDALLDDCAGAALAPGEPLPKVKRACKNCSCGLKDLEEQQPAVKLDLHADDDHDDDNHSDHGAGGCGSCAKGDAFRCAKCPYRGLPAFTPGTKPAIGIKEDGSKVLLDTVDSDVVF